MANCRFYRGFPNFAAFGTWQKICLGGTVVIYSTNVNFHSAANNSDSTDVRWISGGTPVLSVSISNQLSQVSLKHPSFALYGPKLRLFCVSAHKHNGHLLEARKISSQTTKLGAHLGWSGSFLSYLLDSGRIWLQKLRWCTQFCGVSNYQMVAEYITMFLT